MNKYFSPAVGTGIASRVKFVMPQSKRRSAAIFGQFPCQPIMVEQTQKRIKIRRYIHDNIHLVNLYISNVRVRRSYGVARLLVFVGGFRGMDFGSDWIIQTLGSNLQQIERPGGRDAILVDRVDLSQLMKVDDLLHRPKIRSDIMITKYNHFFPNQVIRRKI